MKKFYVAAACLMMGYAANAQVLLSEDFQGDLTHIQIAYPSGDATDPSWYTFDEDGLDDGSPSDRPGEWFLALAFASGDSLTTSGDENLVLASNSWHTSPAQAKNWLITASVDLPFGTGTLTWKSAPFQTPYYLDGYQVKIATTDNDLGSFNTTLFDAGEYVSGLLAEGQAANYTNYIFTPVGSYLHGFDDATNTIVAAEVEDNDGDQARWNGVLTEHTVDLSAYAGQTIFIAFYHNSFDDNLISIDDIELSWTVGVNEKESFLSKVNVYPNPTTDYLTLEYTMSTASPVIMTITDVTGRMVSTESLGIVNAGNNVKTLDVTGFAKGTYNVQLRTDRGVKSLSFVKK